MRREPDVRQEFVERAGTLMRDFAAMDGVRIKTLIDIDSRRFDKAVADVKERQGTAPGIVFGDLYPRMSPRRYKRSARVRISGGAVLARLMRGTSRFGPWCPRRHRSSF
jgi:hypothetical protein